MPSCWIEVNLSALAHNFSAVQSLVGEHCTLICVIKADAYGLGAPEVATALTRAGARWFAVTRLEELQALPSHVSSYPVLLLAPPPPGDTTGLELPSLRVCVGTYEEGKRLSDLARSQGRTALAHLKIDTGMGRFGVDSTQAMALARSLMQLPNFELHGAFTHFANAGDPKNTATSQQFARFTEILGPLKNAMPAGLFHCCNSAATVAFPAMHLNGVRPGTLLYGQYPTPAIAEIGRSLGLQLMDPFVAKARVIALKEMAKGSPLGYGSEWKAPRASKIAVLACGYADGLTLEPRTRPETPWSAVAAGMQRAARLLKNPNFGKMVTIREQRVPLVGRVAMQCCFVDVTSVPGVQIGDEAVVPMRRVNAGAHLPRIYLSGVT